MKTVLPQSINTIEEAKVLLTELNKNGEAFHPEDDATDLVGDIFTKQEGEHLNRLMEDIYDLDGNTAASTSFDPCAFLLWLDMPDTLKDFDLDESVYEIEIHELNAVEINGWPYLKSLDGIYIKQNFKQPTYA